MTTKDKQPASRPGFALRAARRLRRLLRSRVLIVAELCGVAFGGAVQTFIPQLWSSSEAEIARFSAEWPTLAKVLHALVLDNVAYSPWFLALVGLATCSLAVVVFDLWRTARHRLRRRLNRAAFRNAPYRQEIIRDRREGAASETFSRRGRLADLGLPIFHTGLILAVLAGLFRMLFGQDAMIDLIEGETLAPRPSAYGRQFGGLLARGFRMPMPIRFDRLRPARHASGDLSSITADLTLLGSPPRKVKVSVGDALVESGRRLYVTDHHGPAVLIELIRPGERPQRQAMMLRRGRDLSLYEGQGRFGELELRLRAHTGRKARLPRLIETRVLRGGALLAMGDIPRGRSAKLPGVGRLRIAGLRWWVRFTGDYDLAIQLAFVGFGAITLGALLLFGVNRVDLMILVTPLEGGLREKVTVAMKPRRFVPLYQERFDALVSELSDEARELAV